ncbi:hypothetical protein [Mesorhizobium sp. M0909]|uniref:hypothetical protein n=1 Tax=Mesorhizobium sp. M0909 TaxID=2957024 RepID=UPI00333AB33D
MYTLLYDRVENTVTEISRTALHPLPLSEEIEIAKKVLLEDAQAKGIRLPSLFLPIPATMELDPLSSSSPRTVLIGIRGLSWEDAKVVGVDPYERRIYQNAMIAPKGFRHRSTGCGAPTPANQTPTTGRSGTRVLTIRRNGVTIWQALVVRPAQSSATNGSGIELRNVEYRGVTVLDRAHLPILNVKYDGDACGPYRDWQNYESPFEAVGTDVSPGFRECTSMPRTIMESGDDQGSFAGVAIYDDGAGVHLVSELEAGWYRYITRWYLSDSGTLSARFGFAAVGSACVCNRHHHHAYWRFQFNMGGGGTNSVWSVEKTIAGETLQPVNFETPWLRSTMPTRRFQVESPDRNIRCRLEPGPGDISATELDDWPFGRGDVWLLRHKNAELDDGIEAVGPPYETGVGSFVNGEALSGYPLALWYAGHFTHDLSTMAAAAHDHLVGVDLNFSAPKSS